MSVAYRSETPNVAGEVVQQISDSINQRLGPANPPEGGLFHAEGPTRDGGWWTFNLWESEEDFTRFHDDILAPAFAQAGSPPWTYRKLDVAWDTTQVEASHM